MEVSVGDIGGTSMVNEVEFWNGASYDEVVLRDRWIDARTYPTIIPPITPQGLYQTYFDAAIHRDGVSLDAERARDWLVQARGVQGEENHIDGDSG